MMDKVLKKVSSDAASAPVKRLSKAIQDGAKKSGERAAGAAKKTGGMFKSCCGADPNHVAQNV